MSKTDDLRKSFKELKDHMVSVGWFEGNVYPDSGIPVAQVAFWQEFGASRTLKNGHVLTIPARAPLRKCMDDNGQLIADTLVKAIRKGMRDKNMIGALEMFGMFVQSQVQESINSNLPPPNATATVDGMIMNKKTGERAGSSPSKENRKFGQGKGFNSPLIDSGRMLKTVTYKVDKVSEE